MVKIMENPIKIDDFGGKPHYSLETPNLPNACHDSFSGEGEGVEPSFLTDLDSRKKGPTQFPTKRLAVAKKRLVERNHGFLQLS